MASQAQIILYALIGLFALAAATIALARLSPAGRNAQSELWSIYRAEFLIVGVILVPALASAWIFTLALLVLSLRGQTELMRFFGFPAVGVASAVALVSGVILVAAPWLGYPHALHWLFFLCGIAISVPAYLLAPAGRRGSSVAAHVGGLLFPALCCAAAATLRLDANGLAWIVAAYATVEVNDSFALLTGKLFGTRRIFPKLSPGKTVEGFAAGLAGGGAIGTALAMALLGLPLLGAIGFAALMLAAGVAGDLGTSALKRRFAVKDFPPVLKRHGGVLDIYDAFLAAAPAALAFQLCWSA